MAIDYGKVFDEAAKSLNKKLADNKLEKLGINLITAEGKSIATGLSSGERYKMIRELIIGISAAIPYGGAFVSAALSIAMADPDENAVEELKKNLKQMKTDITKETDQKFISLIQGHFDTLLGKLKEFENAVNGTKESYYSTSNFEDTNGVVAREVNEKFKEVLRECQTGITAESGHATGNVQLQAAFLPLYTDVASAHLMFLKFLEANKQGNPRLSIDSKVYEAYFKKDVNESHKKYIRYIEDTYQKNIEHIIEKVNTVAKENGVECSDTYDALRQIRNKRIEMEIRNQAKLDMQLHLGGSGVAPSPEDTSKLVQAEKDIKSIFDSQYKYYMDTVGNSAFQQAAKWGMVKDNDGVVYFLDINGKKETGYWVEAWNRRYFFSPGENFENSSGDKFSEGQLVTGWMDVDMLTRTNGVARSYLFSTVDNFINSDREIFDTGQTVTGWAKIGEPEKWYYFSPGYGLKNSAGEIFDTGQMMTGWVEIQKKWYYLSPAEEGIQNSTNDKFSKGQMVKGTVKISGKNYIFNTNGVCTNPNI